MKMKNKREILWKKRLETLRREHSIWREARDERLREYKRLWKYLETKRKQIREAESMFATLTKNIYRIRKAMGTDEQRLKKLSRKEDFFDKRSKSYRKRKL